MPCIIVLGNHRSGTSAAAGSIHALGVSMGSNLMPPGPSNLKGHFEDMNLVILNALAIGGWGAWPNPQPHITPELERRYAIYTALRSREGLWGIKDPRLCFTLHHILKHVAEGFKIISMNRSKEAIVASLCARKGAGRFTPEEARKVHDRYAEAMCNQLSELDPENVLQVEFDNLIEDPYGEISRIMAFAMPEVEVELKKFEAAVEFIDPNLRHQTEGGAR